MKQSPSVYPANVLADTQNRQQIATILQSMGFETDDIQNAFTIFERSYGEKKYDISVLTEIVFQLQQNQLNQANECKEDIQAHSAPNSPNVAPLAMNDIHKRENILHHNTFQHVPSTDENSKNKDERNASQKDMLSIFNSLEMKPVPPPPKLSHAKASSASPHVYPLRRARAPRRQKVDKTQTASDTKLNLLECLDAFKKYTSDETEIIDVLLQTLNSRADVFNNMVNWNDLLLNIKQRKCEWNQFQTKFDYKLDYDESKHKRICCGIAKHKSNRNNNNCKRNSKTHSKGSSLIERTLEYKYDCAQYSLLNCKDKLLITANTYSILKNNKEKTELMIGKCNEKLQELNQRILALQKEKKQYFSALQRTQNKLLFQIQSIKETEISIKELHESTNKISNEMAAIHATKQCVHKMETQLTNISMLLANNLKQRLEPNWSEWSNRDVIIWLQHIENERFKTDANETDPFEPIKESGLSGKDLPQMNDFILRSSFKIDDANDRKIILKHIRRVTKLKPIKPKHVQPQPQSQSQPQLCVVCTDGEANHIMIPCGHIAVCSKCVNQCKKSKKCPFCANQITNIIKCFHVGF